MNYLTRQFSFAVFATLVSLSASALKAQNTGPHHGNPVLVPASPTGFEMTWHGEANTDYFVEFSTDLISWEYLPFTHRGQNQEVPFWYDSSNSASSLYLRLKWLSNAPLNDADQDGASDLFEVTVLGSDPLVDEPWVKYFADHDGDGIIDLDEIALGLDPNHADSKDSEGVEEAGPVLLTHTYSSDYLFDEGRFGQGQWGTGTWRYQLSQQSPEGGLITDSVSLTDFKQNYLDFEFPLEGEEGEEKLEREYAYVSKWLYHKVALPNTPGAAAYEKIDSDGDEHHEWEIYHTAHMLKLPFPTDHERYFHYLEVPTYRTQETLAPYSSPGPDGETERQKEVRIYGIEDDGIFTEQVGIRIFTVKATERASNVIKTLPALPAATGDKWNLSTHHLLPILKAPDVLDVNSDFDEGRIDSATGYAIPDCDDVAGVDRKTGAGNGPVVLNAVIEYLDGKFEKDDQITEDMHEGWFGIHPQAMNDHFWDGATVTIKKLDRDDPDTGRKESGQIRFYAQWDDDGTKDYYGIEPYDFETLEAVNLVTSGINNEEDQSVYGSNSQIPENAIYWMEGVRPGKITLEWRLQKDDIDVKFEQIFLVATQQFLGEWREEVRYQIRLQTKVNTGSEVDLAQYHPSHGFRNTSTTPPAWHDNRKRVRAIYYYYQQLFKQRPEEFMWAGMAKTAAAPIYAGMSDLTTWWQSSYWVPPMLETDDGIETLIDGLLLGGQIAIFTDKAWTHRAYMASGIWALDWVKENGSPSATDFDAWDDLNQGILTKNQVLINTANRDLLEREQFEVIQQYYFDYATTTLIEQPPALPGTGAVKVAENSDGYANAGEWLSANANKNPMPGGPKFRDTVPGGRIDVYSDRWAWTNNAADGMVQIWTGKATSSTAPKFAAPKRLSENDKTMYSAAIPYSFDVQGLPIE